MFDTSVMLAALVPAHSRHAVARPHLKRNRDSRVPGIVLAETYARLRGAPFNLKADVARAMLQPWWRDGEILDTPAALYARALSDAASLNLGGQIHDYLVALTCAHHGVDLVTADRRQASLARPVLEAAGRRVTLLTE